MVITRQERPRGMDLLLKEEAAVPKIELHRKLGQKHEGFISREDSKYWLPAKIVFSSMKRLSRTTGGLFSPLSFTEIKRSHVHHLLKLRVK